LAHLKLDRVIFRNGDGNYPVTGVQRAASLPARVQGAQLPCAGQGRQPLPSRVDACVGSVLGIA